MLTVICKAFHLSLALTIGDGLQFATVHEACPNVKKTDAMGNTA